MRRPQRVLNTFDRSERIGIRQDGVKFVHVTSRNEFKTEMRMRVEEAGQHGGAGQIKGPRIWRRGHVGADLTDLAVLDQDRLITGGDASLGVYE
jgi:hypothetical protein